MAKLDDGFAAIISFSSNGAVKLYEKEVTPPGLDAGGPNDTTTMRNTRFRTMSPKRLVTATEMNAKCAYDPDVVNQLYAMLGVNQQITVTWPDATTLTIWGWLDKFKPGALKEGEQPTAEVTVHPSNHDNSGVEVAPVQA